YVFSHILGSHDSGSGGGRTSHTARVCTYKEFLNCQPFNFKRTEGVVGLAHWFEKMEYVFHISNYTVECQVKYATCTLLGGALTWWNSYGTDVESYTQRFQELILLCSRMVTDESDKVENYTGGLPDSIQESVMTSKPKLLQEAIELARSLMDHKLLTYAARSPTAVNTQRAPGAVQKTGTCFKCRSQGHYKNDYPKLKNKNHGNAVGNGEACGRAYALGGGEPNPDSNVVTGTFLLNNRYASILFDIGADRSFVSTTFSSLFDIAPSTLDNSYDVELADGRITRANTIIQGCT
ncbi:reverse transcriptase domain-containing protein, partial [Tanacetum coccineum]